MTNKPRLRFTALILCMVMIIGCMPTIGFASNGEESIMLEYAYPEDGDNMFSIATQSAAVDETGKYTVVVVRGGSASDAASVELKTVDVSAAYGEDYFVSIDDGTTDITETEGTLLKQAVDYEEQSARYAAFEEELSGFIESDPEDESVAEDSGLDNQDEAEPESDSIMFADDAAEDITAPFEQDESVSGGEMEAADDVSVAPAEEQSEEAAAVDPADAYEETNVEAENAATDGAAIDTAETSDGAEASESESIDDGKSELAKLKEAQTGKPTRETSQTEFEPIQDLLIENTIGELSDSIETSSSTTIDFLPGETEKYITVEILEDDRSEGDEVFDLMLGGASEGYSIGAGLNCTITITDDEPTEYSKLGFSGAEYTADGSKVTVTVNRTGAEYSFCTADVKTVQIENSAVVSENFSKVDAEISFAPYETEYTFEIPTRGGDTDLYFELELSDIKGAEAGEILRSSVKIPQTGAVSQTESETAAQADESAELAADGGQKSFNITLDKTYTVRYNDGDKIGGIYDTSYNPEVRVGDYYFTESSSYNHFSGSNYHRDSYYDKSRGAAYLYWYDWRTWKTGTSYFYLNGHSQPAFNTSRYQYIAADWEQTRTFGGGQRAAMELHSPSGAKIDVANWRIEGTGSFGRQMSSHIVFLNGNNLPTANDVDVKVLAVDQEKNRTPKVEVHCYGVAAMYREFDVTLVQPNNLDYKTANGGKVSLPPATVQLGEGHNKRYTDQSIQIKVSATADGEPIKGRLKGYSVTVDGNNQSFEYVPSGDNIQNIAIDSDFIKAIDAHTTRVSSKSGGFVTNIRIQPIFEYVDTEVEVLSSENGKFTDTNLTVGKHTYHIGDTISVAGTPNSGYYYDGYLERAYKNASDTQPVVDGNMNASLTELKLAERKYTLRPLFTQQQNHIRIRLSSNAEGKVQIMNAVPEDQLDGTIKGLGGYVLNTSDSGYATEPTVGKVYQIQAIITEAARKEAADRGKVLRPVFTVSSSSEKVNGNAFDMLADEKTENNEVYVDVVEVDASSMKYFKLSGQVTIPGNAIRTSAFDVTEAGAQGVTIIAGANQTKLFDTNTKQEIDILDRKNAISGRDGTFEVKGIYAADGERISVNISNGDVERVAYVTLSSAGLTANEETYYETTYDEDSQTSSGVDVTRPLFNVNAGSINMPVRTPLAPYVSGVDYTVNQIRDITIDTRDNAIPIVSTQINISASVDLRGRSVKEAEFIIVSKNGARSFKKVAATQENQNRFTATYQMDAELSDGDMLYISLIDKEDRVITVGGQQTTEERRYFEVFTGLTFYIPELEVDPQVFEVTMPSSQELPILGNLEPTLSTGALSFTKESLGDGDTAPYYFQFLFTPGISTMQNATAKRSLDRLKDAYGENYADLVGATTDSERQNIKNQLNGIFPPVGGSGGDYNKTLQQQAYSKSLADMSKEVMFDIHLTVLFSLYFTFVQGEGGEPGEYKLALSQYCVGAMAQISKTFYWLPYGVPVFVKITGDADISVSGNVQYDATADISEEDFRYVSNLRDLLFVQPTPAPSATPGASAQPTQEFTAAPEASAQPTPSSTPLPTATPELKGSESWANLAFGVSIVPGVGICGVISARGEIDLDFIDKLNLKNSDSGSMMVLSGGVGVDLLVFSFNYKIGSASVRTGVYDTANAASLSETGDQYTIRPLERGNSDLSKFGQNDEVILSNDDFSKASYQVLSENAAERTNPQIATLGDGRKILFFIDNDPSREAMDAMCLYYSICDANGNWSEPQKVDDNGTADADPKIVSDDGCVFVFWSDANRTFGAEAEEKDVLSSMEIACRMFDPLTDEMGEKEVLTNDNFLDSDANIGYNEETGTIFCYYLKQDINEAEEDTDLVDVGATYSTMACRVFRLGVDTDWSDEYYLDIPHETLTDPLILDFETEAAVYNNENYSVSTYTIDEDNNLNTSDDREAYLLFTNLSTGKAFYPIRLTNDDHADISPKLTRFDGDLLLTWVNGEDNFTTVNISDAITEIENAGLMESMLSSASDDPNWYKLDPASVGEENYANGIFESLANSNFESSSIDFSEEVDGGYIERNIGSYELHNNNDNALYLIWSDVDRSEDGDVQQEIYGAVYQKPTDTTENASDEEVSASLNEYSSWSRAVKLTDFDKMLDEFTVTFDENETMYLCSNMFEQRINDEGDVEYSPNSLAMTTYERGNSLELDGDIEFDSPITAGETTNLRFNLKNNGMFASNGAAVRVVQTVNGEETVVYEQNEESEIISGDGAEFIIPWDVPESIEGLELVVEYSEIGRPETVKREIVTPENRSEIVANNASVEYNDEGVPVFTAELENVGVSGSAELNLTARTPDSYDGEPITYGSLTSEPLAPGETRTVEIEMPDFEFEYLSDYGVAEISLDIEDGENDSVASAVLNASETVDIVFDCEDEIALTAGEQRKISATAMPENASDRAIVYSSSDGAVANVSEDGTITAIGNGTAEIAAYNPATAVERSITVTVTGGPEPTQRPSGGGGSSSGGWSGGTAAATQAPASTQAPDATQAPEATPGAADTGLPFTDVSVDDWFYDAVKYVYDMGLFNGTSDTLFEPDTPMTRGMFTTVLGRASGVDTSSGYENVFTDVDPNEYYAPYIAWASSNGIVEGNGDGTFTPDENITREQMAKIFLDYYRYIGEGPEGAWAIALEYGDVDQISDWAVEGVMFCTLQGLLEGKENNMFDPKGNALRSEVATVLMRANL